MVGEIYYINISFHTSDRLFRQSEIDDFVINLLIEKRMPYDILCDIFAFGKSDMFDFQTRYIC